MLKIAVVTDGPYGDQAHEKINEEFDSEFIELEQPTLMFMDDIEIPEVVLKGIQGADILITYVLHPDLTLELIEILHNIVGRIIVAVWRVEGFKNQLERLGNVTCPENMCNLEENDNPIFEEFVSKFRMPIVEIELEDDKVKEVKILRSSPCGSTFFVAHEMIGQDLKDLPIKAGLKLQHYPRGVPKMRLFTDDECKKEMAVNFHKEAFEKALTV